MESDKEHLPLSFVFTKRKVLLMYKELLKDLWWKYYSH